MPELPEVQTVIDDLSKSLVGGAIDDFILLTPSISRVKKLRPSIFRNLLILRLERIGKHIILHLSNDKSLIIHLKMTGKLTVCDKNDEVIKHTHFIMKLGNRELRFNDIRRFGFIDLVDTSKVHSIEYLARLGIDALAVGAEDFVSLVKCRKKTIKSVLMDQSIISGLGNIYADESLFLAGIRPDRLASTLSKIRLQRLHVAMLDVLRAAIKARGSSVSDYVDGTGSKGTFQNFHNVYGRTGMPCTKCGSAIKRIVIAGRSSHYCPRCQH